MSPRATLNTICQGYSRFEQAARRSTLKVRGVRLEERMHDDVNNIGKLSEIKMKN